MFQERYYLFSVLPIIFLDNTTIRTKTHNMKRQLEINVVRTVTKRPKYAGVSMTADDAVESLKTNGYAVYDIYGLNRARFRGWINWDIVSFPEFTPECTDRRPLGGFGAFNNPSSFHCPSVRCLRRIAYHIISPVLQGLKPDESYHKEMIIDRLMVRPAGVAPSAETWHRDEAPLAHDTDIILGGWINLDDRDQVFSCVPGTHDVVSGHSGFGLIKDKSAIALYNQQRVHVVIPPGHMLIFNEKLIHEVLAKRQKHACYRLFTSWRLTKSLEPLHDNLDEMLDKQAAVTIKSGQQPPMWAKLHWTNWVDKLEEYSKSFVPICREEATVKSGPKAGRVVSRVVRHMKSLVEYGMPTYSPYSPEERSMYKPH